VLSARRLEKIESIATKAMADAAGKVDAENAAEKA
jgi:hypothetical protein